MGSGWYYVENDTRTGPVERSEIERLVSRGSITAHTLVWREGMDGWEEAGNHFSFVNGVSGPPPLPKNTPISGGAATWAHAVGGEANSAGMGGLYAGAPARGFGEAISVCLSKYVTFSGRASRSEYWYFVLFSILVSLAATIVDVAIFGIENDLSPINSLVTLALFLPSTAVGVRRLHDTNRSGWWIGGFWIGLIGVVVMIGLIAAADPYAADEKIASLLGLLTIGWLIYSIVLLVL